MGDAARRIRREPIEVLGRDLGDYWRYPETSPMLAIKRRGHRVIEAPAPKKLTHGIPADLDIVCDLVLNHGMEAYIEYRRRNPRPLRLKPGPGDEVRLPVLRSIRRCSVTQPEPSFSVVFPCRGLSASAGSRRFLYPTRRHDLSGDSVAAW